MKTKLFFGMLTAAATLAVAPAVFAEVTTGTISKEYQRDINDRNGTSLKGQSFTGTSYTTTGEVGDYSLDLTGSGNVYFTGGEGSSLTITSLTGAGRAKGTDGAPYDITNSFIVEGTTVILDGQASSNGGESQLVVEELGLNLAVGTMETATLKITNGAKVTTGAFYSTVGSNSATGTIEISGSGSELNTQQITIGGGDGSLSGKTSDFDAGDYYAQYLITLSEAQALLSEFKQGAVTDHSYGIVNVKDGGTWTVGLTSGNSSQSKLQLSNGEINIDGSGSQLLLGNNSTLTVMGEFISSSDLDKEYIIGLHYTETIKVTDGGKIANADGATPFQVVIGNIWYASNDVVTVLVSGDDGKGNASTFDVTISDTAWIGANAGTWSGVGVMDGGTQDVKITASDGGVFKISADDCVAIAADNYMDSYLWADVAESKYGHSYGITVSLSADSGGLIELNALNGSAVALGAGSPSSDGDYTNNVNVTADNATVSISGGDIYANYGTDGTNDTASENVYVTLKATNGGVMTLSTTSGTVLNKNTAVIVEKGSSLITEGAVLFNQGSSISVDATSTWTTESSVTFSAGSGIEIGAVAADDGKNAVNIAVGSVTISESASISVYVDVSALSDTTLEFTVNLMTGTFDSGFEASNFTSDAGNLTAKFSDETNWAYEYGLALDDSTLQLIVSRTYLPEPSMFSLLFGLGALGLVGTRRRRR